MAGGHTLSVREDPNLQLQPGPRHRPQDRIRHQRHQGCNILKVLDILTRLRLYCVAFFNVLSLFLVPVKEFMRGGEALDHLISDVVKHAEMEALLEAVEKSCSSSRLRPPQSGPSV